MFSLPTPPWNRSFRHLESATRKALYEFSLLKGVTRLAVAVSGGKDSLTLLSLLHAICGRGTDPVELVCLHVSGSFSCGASLPAEFLAAICKEIYVPFYSTALPTDYTPSGCYSCSRIRRKLLFEMAKSHNCTTIAFGHHRDDAIQTLLMNLCHKGEFSGLHPRITLYKYGVTIIRPLIYLSEKDIISFAKKYGFLRMTCSCPHGIESFRKKTDKALDYLTALYPNARENLARAALIHGSKKALTPFPLQPQQTPQ